MQEMRLAYRVFGQMDLKKAIACLAYSSSFDLNLHVYLCIYVYGFGQSRCRNKNILDASASTPLIGVVVNSFATTWLTQILKINGRFGSGRPCSIDN